MSIAADISQAPSVEFQHFFRAFSSAFSVSAWVRVQLRRFSWSSEIKVNAALYAVGRLATAMPSPMPPNCSYRPCFGRRIEAGHDVLDVATGTGRPPPLLRPSSAPSAASPPATSPAMLDRAGQVARYAHHLRSFRWAHAAHAAESSTSSLPARPDAVRRPARALGEFRQYCGQRPRRHHGVDHPNAHCFSASRRSSPVMFQAARLRSGNISVSRISRNSKC